MEPSNDNCRAGWSWDPTRPLVEQWPWNAAPRATGAEAIARYDATPEPEPEPEPELEALEAQNPSLESDDAWPDRLAACSECEVPFGCRDGHCIRGLESTRAPVDQPDALIAAVPELPPDELDAEQCPPVAAEAIERIAEVVGEGDGEP